MAFEVGERVGDYEIVAVLGAGGMGQVYKVRNVISDRAEAMKVLLPNLETDQELADRFIREIKVQASLDHPNIASLHTAQRVGNQLLMIMEFVEGTTLEQILARGRLAARDAIQYIGQVLDALAYAHARGVVHRDIKPANMMLTPAGVVKLMDFGIARMAADRRLTQTGRTVGSLFYMSPEQIKGVQLDARSDLYSLGVTLYELVTGKRPFEGDSDYSIMAAHLQQMPVPPIELDPTVPTALNEIILMSIAKDPLQRFQSAEAFKSALMNVGQMMGVPASQAEPYTRPMPVAPAPTAPAAAVAAPPSPTSRPGLYKVLGSVATLAVLALAVTQGPRVFGTKAGAPPAAPQQLERQRVPPSPPVLTEPLKTDAQQPPRVEQPQPKQTPPVRQERARTEPRERAPQQQTPPPAATREQPQNPSPVVTPPPRQQAAEERPSSGVADARNELRERYNLVTVRGAAAKRALQQLEQQMARQGLGMRNDMVEASTRFDYQMQEAMTAIRGGDAESARRYLRMAEFALEAIEKVVGK